MLSRVRLVSGALRASAFSGPKVHVRHMTTTTSAEAEGTKAPTAPTLSSRQLEELNELGVALTQRGHTCVATQTSPSVAITWCGKQQCTGANRLVQPVQASIAFPPQRRIRVVHFDDSNVRLALWGLAMAPWVGILIGSIACR